MGSCLLGQFVGSVLGQPLLCLFVGESHLDVGLVAFLELFDGHLVVVHELELLGQLDGLVERDLLCGAGLDPGGSVLDGLLKLGVAPLFLVKVHVLLRLNEGSDELTAGLAHDF